MTFAFLQYWPMLSEPSSSSGFEEIIRDWWPMVASIMLEPIKWRWDHMAVPKKFLITTTTKACSMKVGLWLELVGCSKQNEQREQGKTKHPCVPGCTVGKKENADISSKRGIVTGGNINMNLVKVFEFCSINGPSTFYFWDCIIWTESSRNFPVIDPLTIGALNE